MSNDRRRHFWWHQKPGHPWQRHELDVRRGIGPWPYGSGLSSDSSSRRMVLLAVEGTAVSRQLHLPRPPARP